MSETAPDQRPNVSVGRLILDIPGIESSDAGRLAEKVAAYLARDGRAASDVEIPRISIVLDNQTTDLDDLACRIANSLLQRME